MIDDRECVDILADMHTRLGDMVTDTGKALEFIRSRIPRTEEDYKSEYVEVQKRG